MLVAYFFIHSHAFLIPLVFYSLDDSALRNDLYTLAYELHDDVFKSGMSKLYLGIQQSVIQHFIKDFK